MKKLSPEMMKMAPRPLDTAKWERSNALKELGRILSRAIGAYSDVGSRANGDAVIAAERAYYDADDARFGGPRKAPPALATIGTAGELGAVLDKRTWLVCDPSDPERLVWTTRILAARAKLS